MHLLKLVTANFLYSTWKSNSTHRTSGGRAECECWGAPSTEAHGSKPCPCCHASAASCTFWGGAQWRRCGPRLSHPSGSRPGSAWASRRRSPSSLFSSSSSTCVTGGKNGSLRRLRVRGTFFSLWVGFPKERTKEGPANRQITSPWPGRELGRIRLLFDG